MALLGVPSLNPTCESLLTEANELRVELGEATSPPSKWVSQLRRQAEADAYASSTRIEGFELSKRRADAITGGGSPTTDDGELAFAGYLQAMRFVEAAVRGESFNLNLQMLLALHFIACGFQTDVHPGQVRDKSIQVVNSKGELLYEAPDQPELSILLDEFLDSLNDPHTDADPLVFAAMAHLNLVSLHPFEDGNGRVSRIVQSALLASAGPVQPAFGSIEQYLGDNTLEYYSILREVQHGSFQPERSALPWVEFCLTAHVHQARTRLAQVSDAASRWSALERLIADRGWPDRLVIALEMAMTVGLERSVYAVEADIPIPTASGDLRRLADSGLLEAHGGGRSTHYKPSDALRNLI